MPRGSCFSKSEIHISLSLNEAMNIAILAMVYMHPHHLSAWTRLQLWHTRRQQLNLWLVEYHIRKYHTIMSCLASSENQDGTRKTALWRGKSSSKPSCLGSMLIFRDVFYLARFTLNCVPRSPRHMISSLRLVQSGYRLFDCSLRTLEDKINIGSG